MKAIIIAGGRGERLRPITDNIPKPMVKIVGKPILQYTIELLRKHGVTDLIIALCYLPQSIIDYFGDGSAFGVSIIYSFEDPTVPRGTAGAIIPARSLINDTFIVTYADTLRQLNIEDMIYQHKEKRSLARINVYKHEVSNLKSILKFETDRQLTVFTELPEDTAKPEIPWSNGSFYIFEPRIFNFISTKAKADFSRDIFPAILKTKEKIFVYPTSGYFLDIGTRETLEKAERVIKDLGLLL